MFYVNYKNFQFPKNYKGFKITSNPEIKTFRVFEKSRNIEYAPDFVEHLNGYQKYFIVLYLTKLYKLKDVARASTAAVDAYKLNGLPEDDIFDLLTRINNNKRIQKFIQANILDWLFTNKLKLNFYKFLNFFNYVRRNKKS